MEIPMEDVLRSKISYWITLGKEKPLTNANKKAKWDNNGNTCGLIRLHISPYFLFHIQGMDDLDEVWEKLKIIFGQPNVIRSHQLENQIITLSPNNFSFIVVYLSKFKTLRHLLKNYQIELNDECIIYIILSQLGFTYFVFASIFYATRETIGFAY